MFANAAKQTQTQMQTQCIQKQQQQNSAEFALDVALPWDKGLSGLTSGRLTKRAGLRVDFAF